MLANIQKVFDLPAEILSTIQLKDQDIPAIEEESRSEAQPDPVDAVPYGEEYTALGSASCTLCGSAFKDVQEQRQHVKSDFHRYNLKQKLKGLSLVDEAQFDTLIHGGSQNKFFKGQTRSPID